MTEEMSDEELFGPEEEIVSHGMTVGDQSTADALDEVLGASANGSPAAMTSQPGDADPDEEPPEPEGHALTREMADFIEGDDFFRGPLPHDIAAIWGHPPMRRGDEATARILIGAWGEETFRGSAVHQAALQSVAREAVTAPSRQQFKAERDKAKKKR
jgi:hypothetical protein